MEENNICFELKKLTNLVKRSIDKAFNNKITHTQLFILNYIDMCNVKGDIAYQKDLEHIFEIRRSTVSEILNTMEKNKFIKRIDLSVESKVKQLVLDENGIELVEEFKSHIKDMQKHITKNISIEELEVFMNILNKIKENVEEIC